MSELPYSERELIQRAIDQAAQYGANCGQPRWVSVKRLFAVGSGVAEAICWKYGYDPDKDIGGAST
jgi:hypothetical protein